MGAVVVGTGAVVVGHQVAEVVLVRVHVGAVVLLGQWDPELPPEIGPNYWTGDAFLPPRYSQIITEAEGRRND